MYVPVIEKPDGRGVFRSISYFNLCNCVHKMCSRRAGVEMEVTENDVCLHGVPGKRAVLGHPSVRSHGPHTTGSAVRGGGLPYTT